MKYSYLSNILKIQLALLNNLLLLERFQAKMSYLYYLKNLITNLALLNNIFC